MAANGTIYQTLTMKRTFLRHSYTYKPWEVEEITCVFTFGEKKFDQIFNDIHDDVHPTSPVYAGEYPPTPPGAFDFNSSCQSCIPLPYYYASAASLYSLSMTNPLVK